MFCLSLYIFFIYNYCTLQNAVTQTHDYSPSMPCKSCRRDREAVICVARLGLWSWKYLSRHTASKTAKNAKRSKVGTTITSFSYTLITGRRREVGEERGRERERKGQILGQRERRQRSQRVQITGEHRLFQEQGQKTTKKGTSLRILGVPYCIEVRPMGQGTQVWSLLRA